MTEVNTGVPLIVFEQRSEDEEIENLLREYLAEEDGQVGTTDSTIDLNPIAPDTVRRPTLDLNHVNEQTTQGYIAMAFPCLLPEGRADLRDQSQRQVELGTAQYFDALLRYKDARFGSHPRYIVGLSLNLINRLPFFALNTKLGTQTQSQADSFNRTNLQPVNNDGDSGVFSSGQGENIQQTHGMDIISSFTIDSQLIW